MEKVGILSAAIKQQGFATSQEQMPFYPKLIRPLIHEVLRYEDSFKSEIANEL